MKGMFLQRVFTLLFFSVLGVGFCTTATDVTSLRLGSSGTFHSPVVMHGTYAFTQIQITFDTDVFVDFYDLQLTAISPAPYSIPLSGFSYNPSTRTAVWQVDGQPAEQNERFRVVLSGVWDSGGIPLAGGGYTNYFSVLTGDVTGDDVVSPIDMLTLMNHLDAGSPYDPALDINLDGQVSSLDSLIVINMLNAMGGGSISLIGTGPYHAVSTDPAADLRIGEVEVHPSVVTLMVSNLPTGSRLKVEGKGTLSETNWNEVLDCFVTNGMDQVSFPKPLSHPAGFYRASFR